MPSSSVRLLMLHSKLESLRDRSSGHEQLYAAKHSMLPLSTHKDLSSTVDSEPLLPTTQRKALGFVPKVRAVTGAISNPMVVASATAVLLGAIVFVSTIFNKPQTNSSSVQIARASSLSSISSISSSSDDSVGLRSQYEALSKERGYGEVLFQPLSLEKTVSLELDTVSIPVGSSSGFEHVEYSVLPGVRGHSIFVEESSLHQKPLSALIPGAKVSLVVGDRKKPSAKYNYIYIANNTYAFGDSALLTMTQKSILNLVVKTDQKTVQSYQFRLIGVE